jgi:hypothetical protein
LDFDGKCTAFFSLTGLELPRQNRPAGAQVPKEHSGLYYIYTAIKANVGITYWDVKSGRAGWADIARVMQGEQLLGYLEWENHAIAEARRSK